MDPVTHALVGAAAARTIVSRRLAERAWVAGAAGALLPDADALIRSSADPLLYAEFHRHFTHALAFIPVGGAIAALPWILSRRTRAQWRGFLGAATVGYATHGVLDASTSWGTLLYWPFSDTRVAWNLVSIVDPLVTVVVLGGVAAAAWTKRAAPAAVALAAALVYLGIGGVQRSRALTAQDRIAAMRNHTPERAAVFPAFATNLVWRSLYRRGDTLYVDRIRVPWFGRPQWSEGYSMRAVTEGDLSPRAAADARARRDFGRFRRFAANWLAAAPDAPDLIGDGRYSSSNDRFAPVWGIRLRPGKTVPVEWVDRSAQRRVDPREVWDELRGVDPRYRTLHPAGE